MSLHRTVVIILTQSSEGPRRASLEASGYECAIFLVISGLRILKGNGRRLGPRVR